VYWKVVALGGAGAEIVRTAALLERVSKNCPLLFSVIWFPFASVVVPADRDPIPRDVGGCMTCPEGDVTVAMV